jgi:hypothetical protein
MNPNLRSWWDRHPEVRDFAARMIADKAWTPDIQEAVRARFGDELIPTTVQLSRLRTGLARGRWTMPKPEGKRASDTDSLAVISQPAAPEAMQEADPIFIEVPGSLNRITHDEQAGVARHCPCTLPAPEAPTTDMVLDGLMAADGHAPRVRRTQLGYRALGVEVFQSVQDGRAEAPELMDSQIEGATRHSRSPCLKRQVSSGRPRYFADGRIAPCSSPVKAAGITSPTGCVTRRQEP